MYESSDIIQYLVETYGTGEVPKGLEDGYGNVVKIGLALAPRLGKGSKKNKVRPPSPTHSFMQSSIYPVVHPITFPFIHSSPYPFIHSSTHPP